MKLIIVRHGETDHNARGHLAGFSEAKITPQGFVQIRQVAERLRAEQIQAAYSSDLERAVLTAEGILEFHPDLTLQLAPELRERHMGEFEGKAREEFLAAAKADAVHWADFKPAGGESMRETQVRAKKFITTLMKKASEQTVLIVSHGGMIRALLAELLNRPLEAKPIIQTDNASVTILETVDGAHRARVINDITHLINPV